MQRKDRVSVGRDKCTTIVRMSTKTKLSLSHLWESACSRTSHCHGVAVVTTVKPPIMKEIVKGYYKKALYKKKTTFIFSFSLDIANSLRGVRT